MIQLYTIGGFCIEDVPRAAFIISEDIPSCIIEDFAKDLDLAIGIGLGYHSKRGLGIGGPYNMGIVGPYNIGVEQRR